MITVSLISHEHGMMVHKLVQQLLTCPQITMIIVTLDVCEKELENIFTNNPCSRIKVIKNNKIKGFGENHNAAFKHCNTLYYCIINPDVILINNPFEKLIFYSKIHENGLIAPLAINENGDHEDNARQFLSLNTLVKQKLVLGADTYDTRSKNEILSVDWVSGLFMFLTKTTYDEVCGFDEKYFMYCEDADLCARIWQQGKKVILLPEIKVIHNARRSSRKILKHFSWHLQSILRFLIKYSGQLRAYNK